MKLNHLNILITKETRAGETRVSLVPQDVRILINKGHQVFVEHNAGFNAGFSDQDYSDAGANIRFLNNLDRSNFQKYFADIDVIVRAKRPDREREILENATIASGTIMIGALDPYEKNSDHINEYQQAKISTFSIDQLSLDENNPMNVLAAMSKIAGRLALLDAIKRSAKPINKVVIIGFGIAGRSAFAEAISQQLKTTVILTNDTQTSSIEKAGAIAVMLNKTDVLSKQQQIVKQELLDADVVITTARRANQLAPLLIPNNTLQQMKKGAVIVDMALSEGGNVEGSEHDASLILGNGVIVTNVSGYPKAVPNEASILWSKATLHFILSLDTFIE